ncbi:MAG: hypothetical protein ACK5HL_03100 [Bacilli bacterium]
MEIILDYWLEFCLTITSGILITLYKKGKKYIEKIQIVENSVINILKKEIYDLYDKYSLLEEIDFYELERIKSFTKEYKKLSGDDTLDHLINNIDKRNVCLLKKGDVKNGIDISK